MPLEPIYLLQPLILGWLAIGLFGIAFPRRLRFVGHVLFPVSALVSLALAGLALVALGQAPSALVLPIGLPDMPFHIRLDALSSFFLFLIGAASAGISLFSAGYFRAGQGSAPGLLCLEYHLFLIGMAMVVLANDAYLFMVAWETMALASYFLVTTQHTVPEIRRAGFLYLLIAHLGAVALLLAFGVLHGIHGDYTFDAMRATTLSPAWATAGFCLALAGFGAKAGLMPLHVWLPEAHPAAPSPVSALMSGVMLKTAIYGVLRVSFDLLHLQIWWWGLLTLGLGLATAVFGVVFAAAQTDMKRLLAYSSIENIGIIFTGIGLAIMFRAFEMPMLAALALAAILYHCLNHAFFKGLLFLATGSVLHATKERSLGKLGGLIHRMPWVAGLALVGTLAIAGVPPLNGFVSEWMLLQAFLFTPSLPHGFVNMLVPVGAAALALTAALSGYVMVKFYGVIFLGQPREPNLAQAHDCGVLERAGMIWLAAGCVLLGVFPVYVLQAIDRITLLLVESGIGRNSGSWWLMSPISVDRASYSPLLVLTCITLVVAATFAVVRRVYHGRMRRSAAWDCGFPAQTPRMQDTAEGFGQPIRQIFEPFFRLERELPTASDRTPRYRVSVADHWWYWLYLPVARATAFVSGLAAWFQSGRISTYLLFSFVTLLLLLVFV